MQLNAIEERRIWMQCLKTHRVVDGLNRKFFTIQKRIRDATAETLLLIILSVSPTLWVKWMTTLNNNLMNTQGH